MSILTQPRPDRIPIGWATINGQRTPVVLDLEWARYLAVLDQRAGGITGTGTTELSEEAFEDAGIEEMRAGMFAVNDGFGQLPPAGAAPALDVMSDEVAGLREQVAELAKAINDIKQGSA